MMGAKKRKTMHGSFVCWSTWHCSECHHEWQAVDNDGALQHCYWCGAKGYPLAAEEVVSFLRTLCACRGTGVVTRGRIEPREFPCSVCTCQTCGGDPKGVRVEGHWTDCPDCGGE